jgi:hypothetical protein
MNLAPAGRSEGAPTFCKDGRARAVALLRWSVNSAWHVLGGGLAGAVVLWLR